MTPTDAGTPGDIVFDETLVSQGDYVGWVYTNDKDWREDCLSVLRNQDKYIFDKVGIGTTTLSGSMFRVGAGSTLVAIDAGIVTATGVVFGVVELQQAYIVMEMQHSLLQVTASSFVGDIQIQQILNVTAAGWGQLMQHMQVQVAPESMPCLVM